MRYLISILTSLCIAITCLPAYAQGSGLYIVPDATTIVSPIAGQTWRFNSTSRTFSVYNGSSYTILNYPFSNLTATTNPTAANDNTQGYVMGSFWLNQTTQTLFVATSVVTSTAVWLGVNEVTASIPLNTLQQGGATNGQSLIWSTGAGQWQPGSPSILLSQLLQSGATSGQVPSWNGTAWVATNAAAGTVTTFSSGNLSPLFTSSVASPTSTPALTFSLSNAGAHTILSNTTGSSAAPAYNSLSITAGTGLSGGGNVTTSPTISLTTPVVVANGGTGAATTTAHTYFGNNSGITGAPGFVGIVTGDLPSGVPGSVANTATVLTAGTASNILNIGYSGTALPILNGGTGSTTAAGAATNILPTATTGQIPSWSGTAWVATTVSGTGTVTSAAMTGDGTVFNSSVTGSPITTTGTFAPTLANAVAKGILSNTSSSPAAPLYNNLTLTTTSGLTGGGNLTDNLVIGLSTPLSNSSLSNTVVTSAGTLSPLFTTTIGSQTLNFNLDTAAPHAYLGNSTGSTAVPAFQAIAAADLPSTTVNTTGNLSPLFTSSITGQALGFVLSNATGNGILSNTSGSPGSPSYNVLSLTAGTGLSITSSGHLAASPTVSLQTPVSIANGGTGTALFSSGQATFVSSGSIAVADTSITSSSIIVVTEVNTAPSTDSYSVAVSAGVGFTVYSSNSSSTQTVNYIRIK